MHLSARCPPAPDPAPCTPQVCVVVPSPPTGPRPLISHFVRRRFCPSVGSLGNVCGSPTCFLQILRNIIQTPHGPRGPIPPAAYSIATTIVPFERITETWTAGRSHGLFTDWLQDLTVEEVRIFARLSVSPDPHVGVQCSPLIPNTSRKWSAHSLMLSLSLSIYRLYILFCLQTAFRFLISISNSNSGRGGSLRFFCLDSIVNLRFFWSPSPFFSFNDQFVVFYFPISLFPPCDCLLDKNKIS